MITISGVQKNKIISIFFILFLLYNVNSFAQNIDELPLINLDELEPSYDEDLVETIEDFQNTNDGITGFNKNHNQDPFITIGLLNKITAEVRTIDINLKENYLLEDLKIYAIDCYNSEPLEKKETAVYLNIYNRYSMKKIFNGWMIKSLPSVSSMEHPIYDLWVDGCYKL